MELFVHILLACSVLVSVIAANPGHELHHGADHIHQPRQEGGAPFAGIESLSYSVNLDSNTPTFPTVTQTKRSTTQSSGSIRSTTGPTTYLPLETGSIGPFPVTQFAVAIATICSSGVSPISNATNSSASIGNTSAALSVGLYDAKMVSELPAAATTLLRLNSSETHNTSASTPTFTAFDSQGCSRLYTMTSSAICATLLKGVGALPVRVTDCEQSVTFSTSTGCGPAPTAVGLNSTTAQGASAREHLAYFVAPWHELTDGRVPSRVVVQNCVQGIEEEEEACGTVTESWRVVNQTSLLTIIGTLAFQGPVTGVSHHIILTHSLLGGKLLTTCLCIFSQQP